MGATLASSFVHRAYGQTTRVWRVGFLVSRAGDAEFDAEIRRPFLEGMRAIGYVEGKNVRFEWRFSDGHHERLVALAAELTAAKPDVIVAQATPATRAAQQATRTIPIVMVSVSDPVGSGLVKSLARPDGNTTGISNLGGESTIKQLEYLVDAVPKSRRVAVLMNPTNPFHKRAFSDLEIAAKKHKVSLVPFNADREEDLEPAFVGMQRENVGALIMVADAFFGVHRAKIVSLAAKFRLPAIYNRREYVESGGLMSYGRNSHEIHRRAALYVDKILKGAKPADLPVEQSNVELVINRATAKKLGIGFSKEILVRADKIVE